MGGTHPGCGYRQGSHAVPVCPRGWGGFGVGNRWSPRGVPTAGRDGGAGSLREAELEKWKGGCRVRSKGGILMRRQPGSLFPR